ncbi:MAG: hypothetical protein N3E37_02770 [Candidatus Micrarchaeota archaeon]|nr:hypothetical protein [Candidatus Micrarchaeota archaeon]
MLRKPFEYDIELKEDDDIGFNRDDHQSKVKIRIIYIFLIIAVFSSILSVIYLAETLFTSKTNIRGFKYIVPLRVSISSGTTGYYEAHVIITLQNRAGKNLVVYLSDVNRGSILFQYLSAKSDCYLDSLKEFSVRDDTGNVVLVGHNKISLPNGREITIIGTIRSQNQNQICSSAIGNFYRYNINIVAEDEYGIIVKDSGLVEGYFS